MHGGGQGNNPPESVRDDSRREQRLSDRQFLTYDGVAGATLSARMRNAAKQRLERGSVAASECRAAQHNQVSAPAENIEEIEQRVEDQIQIAIAKGEFDNLEGKGQPLRRLQPAADNPFLDRGDRVGFDLLQKHGYAPEWIERQKEIRAMHVKAVRILAAAWLDCGENPTPSWLAQRDAFRETLKDLNRRIRDYNLICPATSQMPNFVLVEEVRRVRREAPKILGRATSTLEPVGMAVTSPSKQKRLMTPLRDVFGSSKNGSMAAKASSGLSKQSLWSRVVAAVTFQKASPGI